MSTRLLLITATILFLLANFALAAGPKSLDDVVTDYPRASKKPTAFKNIAKQEQRNYWSGRNTKFVDAALYDEKISNGLGISEEQRKTMQEARRHFEYNSENDPDIKPIWEQVQNVMSEMDNLPPGSSKAGETQTKYDELQGKLRLAYYKKQDDIILDMMTEKQKMKLKEFQISTMSVTPAVVEPKMFEALNLSDKQKEQLSGIQKNLEPEFEKFLDLMANREQSYYAKMDRELSGKLDGRPDMDTRVRIIEDARKRVIAANPEIPALEKESREQWKGFTNKLKFQMYDVLTDEQMERLAQLIDNPPDYVKEFLELMRKEYESESSDPDEWVPGPNSWKPGDPIPEEYLKERRKPRFPQRK